MRNSKSSNTQPQTNRHRRRNSHCGACGRVLVSYEKSDCNWCAGLKAAYGPSWEVLWAK